MGEDVVEKDGQVDGDHQALLGLPSHGCELEADGPIRREALNRYV